MYLTRKFKFDAAHELPHYKGKCSNLHGHTWHLEIEVEGLPNVTTGMIMDFSTLKKIVDTLIIDQLDHYFINDIIKNPTAEMMVYWIVDQLNELAEFSNTKLSRVRLYETEDSYAEWRKVW